jgi:membrane fusion protein (multidrug efflux system)
MKKVLFPALIVIFPLIFILSFVKDHISFVRGFPVYKKTKKEIIEKKLEEIPIPVKVYKIAKVSFRDTLPSLGTMRGFRQIDLKFSVQGTIEYINFKEGERITQGDIIASLDQKEALLKLEYAKLELDKQMQLLELGSIVESKAKQSQLEYQSAKAELDKTNLVAISDGYIGSIDVDKGSYISPQDKIGTFVDVKDVYIEFGVIEKDVSKIKEGQNVEVSVESFPDQVFKGQIDSVSPMVEGRSRTVQVKAKISNVDEKIKPGMFGRVNVLVYEKEQALVIPSSSFKKKEDQYLVYLVHPEEVAAEQFEEAPQEVSPALEKKKKKGLSLPFGKKTAKTEETLPAAEQEKMAMGTIEIRPIEISYATPDAVEIKEGLEEGDLVVMDLEQDLQDKGKVEITETQEGIF